MRLMGLWKDVRFKLSNGRVTSATLKGNISKGTKITLPLPSGHYAIFKAVDYDKGITRLVRIKTVKSLDKLFDSITL